MRKKVLVTGSSGQLGSALIHRLQNDYEIAGTDLKKPEFPSKNSFYCSDLTSGEDVGKLFQAVQPDVIVHAAAMTNVDGCEREPFLAESVNVGTLRNILTCARPSAAVVLISTDYVFSGNNGPYSEDDRPDPASVYGRTKLMAETLLTQSDRRFCILRPNVLYGGDLNSPVSFVGWVYRSLQSGSQIRVVTDQVSNPTFLPDFCEVIAFVIENNVQGLYHFGSSNALSRFEFALQVALVFGLDDQLMSPILTSELNQDAPRPANSTMETGKIKRDLKVNTCTTLDSLNRIKQNWKS